jgi:hypothetical protein
LYTCFLRLQHQQDDIRAFAHLLSLGARRSSSEAVWMPSLCGPYEALRLHSLRIHDHLLDISFFCLVSDNITPRTISWFVTARPFQVVLRCRFCLRTGRQDVRDWTWTVKRWNMFQADRTVEQYHGCLGQKNCKPWPAMEESLWIVKSKLSDLSNLSISKFPTVQSFTFDLQSLSTPVHSSDHLSTLVHMQLELSDQAPISCSSRLESSARNCS